MLLAVRNTGLTGQLAGSKSTTAFRRGSDIEHPAGNPVWDQIKGLLAELQKSPTTLKTIVIVSGDVHFSCNLDGQLPKASSGPRLLQLISSGLRQRISDAKQGQLVSAYRGWLNTVSSAEGVDKHRGIVITLGGLAKDGRTDNFIYPPSFAVVTTRIVPFGPKGRTVPVPLVEQQHFVADPRAGLVPWSMRHMTQGDGSALMSLHDPGFRHPARPTAYPKTTGGIGVAREHEDRVEGDRVKADWLADDQFDQDLLDEGLGAERLGLEALDHPSATEGEEPEAIVLEVEADDESPLPFDECLADEDEGPADAVMLLAEEFADDEAEADDASEAAREPGEASAGEADEDTEGEGDGFEREVFGRDDRVLVTDTLTVPARWVCAIDLFTDDPKLGKGAPLVKSLSRATGILIGPCHVLTAAHVLDDATIVVDGTERKAPVTRVRVSPARNGNNDKHPLGSAWSSAFRRPQTFNALNDYALIVLESDLSQATHRAFKGPLGYWGKDPQVAALQVLDPATLGAPACTVIGYPGDRCGKKPIEHVERKIRHCAQRQPDIWASTAWQSTGTARPRVGVALVPHEIDTWDGESGAPLFLLRGGTFHLLAVHGGAMQDGQGQATRNRAARVTAQMRALFDAPEASIHLVATGTAAKTTGTTVWVYPGMAITVVGGTFLLV